MNRMELSFRRNEDFDGYEPMDDRTWEAFMSDVLTFAYDWCDKNLYGDKGDDNE